MEDINRRRQSFGKWPKESPVKADDLADNGFYYIGPGDKVKCHRCKLVLCEWHKGDDPATEHSKHRPQCPLASSLPGDEWTTHTSGEVEADVVKYADAEYNPGVSEGVTNVPPCIRCGTSLATVRLYPCSCFVMCQPCAHSVESCPKCDKPIEDRQLFRSM